MGSVVVVAVASVVVKPAVALSLWTLYVWSTRIRNAWGDDDLSAGAAWAATALSASFIAFAGATLAWAWTTRRTGFPPCTRYLLVPFAVWTTAVWAVRGADIALGDHDVAFVVVHVALGVISAALAWWAVSRLPGGRDERTGDGALSPRETSTTG